MLTFKALAPAEASRLKQALQRNLLEEDGGMGEALLLGRDTSFVGTAPVLDEDAEVITAIKSVPCHY